MPSTVLDSHALIAFLRGEAGEDLVARLLEKAGEWDAPLHRTDLNYAEVKSKNVRPFDPYVPTQEPRANGNSNLAASAVRYPWADPGRRVGHSTDV